MKEWYADLTLTKEISEWLLVQEATVAPSGSMPLYEFGRTYADKPTVTFGHRRVHFYSAGHHGVHEVRIFFNEDTIGSALILMLKFPGAIFKHNIPKELM